jgi:riboflavin synthase
MFTGLVAETGELLALDRAGDSARLTLRSPLLAPSAALGDSISVNGCCLTVADADRDRLTFDVLAQTLRVTNLGDLAPGSKVNLEAALGAGDKMGGHFVQGHVDTTAALLDYSTHGADHRLEIAIPAGFAQYIVAKGSICVDGISLTVADLRESSFVCWIIPTTHSLTNLQNRRTGERVNLEFDVLAKYVERMLLLRQP